MRRCRYGLLTRPRALPLLAALLLPLAGRAGPPDEERKKSHAAAPSPRAAATYDFDADVSAELVDMAPPAPAAGAEAGFETVGVTAGGVRGIDLVRAQIEAGEVPKPALITAEGLLSEHDLPLRTGACDQLLCVRAETIDATLITEPAVHYIAQLGFASDVDLATLRRPPLNVVVVIDQSTSMNGAPMRTAQAAARALASQLRPDDQLSLLGFGVEPRVVSSPQPPNPGAFGVLVDGLVAHGATALERGLFAGFELARRSGQWFPGATRVVLITDDRPNVGRTTQGTFLALARAAASRGVGLTTIGVGAQFDAPLAYALSGVAGGNALYLRSPEHARARLSEDLGGLVHELARALVIEIEPAPGMRVVDVYGVPGELLTRDGDRVSLRVETLFVSKRRGAIYLALAPKGRANLPRAPVRLGAELGRVSIRYRTMEGALLSDRVALRNRSPRGASPGLTRGALLLDQFTVTRRVGELVYESGNVQAAYELARALAERYTPVADDELQAQRELVLALAELLSGRAAQAGAPRRLFAPPP